MIAIMLQQTPKWVFFVFFGLLYLGYAQSRSRTASKGKVAALPLIMVTLSLLGIFSAFGADAVALSSWAIGIGLALLLNGALKQPSGVTYSVETRRFTLPGSWQPLAFMMAIFFSKYVVSATLALHPSSRQVAGFVGPASLSFGFFSGIFFARFLHIWGHARAASPAGADLSAAIAIRVPYRKDQDGMRSVEG